MLYFNFYELQDTGMKRTCSSQNPGEWAGMMVKSINGRVMLLVSSKKHLREEVIGECIQEETVVKEKLDFKQLKRNRFFFVYLSRTYRNMCPNLKRRASCFRFLAFR